ncbi:TPA: hypothetical protein KNL07_002822 [Clostridioides difficile]|nr:hypothetical protein [Clostridioides difficile]
MNTLLKHMTQMDFILTMWYVNSEVDVYIGALAVSFILTMWYVKVLNIDSTTSQTQVLY